MKVVGVGASEFENYRLIEKVVALSNFNVSVVLTGKACGMSNLVGAYARNHKILVQEFKPNAADAVIAIWDGNSAIFKPGRAHDNCTIKHII